MSVVSKCLKNYPATCWFIWSLKHLSWAKLLFHFNKFSNSFWKKQGCYYYIILKTLFKSKFITPKRAVFHSQIIIEVLIMCKILDFDKNNPRFRLKFKNVITVNSWICNLKLKCILINIYSDSKNWTYDV